MKRNIGVVGIRTELGCLLLEKPNFVPVDIDTVSLSKDTAPFLGDVDILVNCNVVLSVPEKFSDEQFTHAVKLNFEGLKNLHKFYGNKVLTISSTKIAKWGQPYEFIMFTAEEASRVNNGKIIRFAPKSSLQFMADRIEKHVADYDNQSRITIAKRNWLETLFKW